MPLEETISHGSVRAQERIDAIELENRTPIPSSDARACYHYRVPEPSDVGSDEMHRRVQVSPAKLAIRLSDKKLEARRTA